jgi:phospholipid/cholesterol/gamma-HCH transport system substrate-binding protein
MSEKFVAPVRFSRLVLKVNAFLLVGLLMVGAFMLLVAYKQGWFVQQTPVHFITANALGVNRGMPVKLYGFTVGSVSDLQLSPAGVDVTLSIINEYLGRIPKGSEARFAREGGVVGASVIELQPGPAGPPLAAGERIVFHPQRGISEIVDDFRRQAVPAFNEVKNLFAQLKAPGDDVAATLTGVRAEIQRLPETHRALQKLIATAERTTTELGQQSIATMRATQRTAEAAERAVAPLPALVEKASAAVESIDAAAAQARRTGEEAQGTLQRARPLIERGESAARDAGEVLGAAKRVWPLSDSFREATDRDLPIDSFEARGKALRP